MTLQDEVIYVVILASSVAAGFFIRTVEKVWLKQLLSSFFGFVVTALLCQWETLHSVAAIFGTLCIIKSHSRHTPLLAFVFVFSYLLFFRCSTFFGLPKASAVGNAVQLLLTLKLISVAIEIHDYRQEKLQKKKDDNDVKRFQLSLKDEPSIYDIVCYSYCYVGLFTGPFFKFRTYRDFLDLPSHLSAVIPWQKEVIERIKLVLLYAVLYLAASHIFSVEHVKSDDFYDHTYWYRLLYMIPIFFMARMRFYLAWLISECSFITAAFGAYPSSSKPHVGHGPTLDPNDAKSNESDSVEYSFEVIHNINPSGSEWSKTVRDGMRNWNMTVQWWLVNYVGKRWPVNLKQFRTAAVLGCSAYWHGIAPGYFGAFLTMPFVMLAEDMMRKTVKNRLPETMHSYYDWVNWFFKMRSFEYMFMAFALLTWQDTYRWWKSVYFVGHLSCAVVIGSCIVLTNILRKRRHEQEKDE